MLHKNFEEFLQYKFTTEMFPEILDDDLPDRFNDYEWDTEELIKYADEYRKHTVENLIEEMPPKLLLYEDGVLDATGELYTDHLKQYLRAKWLGKENNVSN